MKWEYATFKANKINADLAEELTKIGADGWEAWAIKEETIGLSGLFYIVQLKRPIGKK